MPTVDVYLGDLRLERRRLIDGRTRVGRTAADNDLSFEHLGVADVSARHLELHADQGRLRAVDLGSRNGTRLNGSPLQGEAELADGDELALGSVRLVIRAGESALEWAVARIEPLYAAPSGSARLRVVVSEARAATGAEVAWALRWDGPPSAPRYRVLVHEGRTDEVPEPGRFPRSIVGRAAASGRPVWTDDASADERFQHRESVRALHLRGAGAVPLGDGVLYLAFSGPGPGELGRARVEALCRIAGAMLGDRTAPGSTPEDDEVLPGLVSRSPAMRDLADQIRVFAALGYRILLLGERGTGKSAVARAIHELSHVPGELVHADCPNLVPTLAESLLFGHEKGSFANATHRHVGWVERASRGTLFLDEIGELPAEVQPKLLALLEEGTFEPVGGTRRLAFDGRVIAATNRDLDDPQSPFRRDLFDRLAQVVLRLPPLRERPEDVEPLARRFFVVESARIRALGAWAPVGVSDAAIAVLRSLPLDGNVRALQSALIRAIAKAVIDRSDEVLPRHLDGLEGTAISPATPLDFREAVRAYERSLIERALAAADGHQTRARELLGLSNGAWDRAKKRAGL